MTDNRKELWIIVVLLALVFIVLMFFGGCSPLVHNHIEEDLETPIIVDNICSPNSNYINCYNSCRMISQDRDEMDLCPRNCHRTICLQKEWLY